MQTDWSIVQGSGKVWHFSTLLGKFSQFQLVLSLRLWFLCTIHMAAPSFPPSTHTCTQVTECSQFGVNLPWPRDVTVLSFWINYSRVQIISLSPLLVVNFLLSLFCVGFVLRIKLCCICSNVLWYSVGIYIQDTKRILAFFCVWKEEQEDELLLS